MGNGVLRVSTMPRPAIQKQPLLFAADAFVAALGAVPAEDWCRTWAAGRTIMLRRTSKKVKEAVDKMRLPAVVRLSRSFWDDARNGTGEEKRQVVLRQLAAMTGWCRISTLELPRCDMKGQDAEILAGVLRLSGVLGQCRELVHLSLSGNYIVAGGAERLASNLIDQKNTRVRALKALISSECPFWFLRQISCSWNVGIICSRKNQ